MHPQEKKRIEAIRRNSRCIQEYREMLQRRKEWEENDERIENEKRVKESINFRIITFPGEEKEEK